VDDDVLITADFPPLKLELVDIGVDCFFHEANVYYREFGKNVLEVYEDMSHLWGALWIPITNQKFVNNLTKFLKIFKDQNGYFPNVRDTVKLMICESLEPVAMQPKTRKAFQYYIKAKNGFQAEFNSGFIHYVMLDNLLQRIQDGMAQVGFRI